MTLAVKVALNQNTTNTTNILSSSNEFRLILLTTEVVELEYDFFKKFPSEM